MGHFKSNWKRWDTENGKGNELSESRTQTGVPSEEDFRFGFTLRVKTCMKSEFHQRKVR